MQVSFYFISFVLFDELNNFERERERKSETDSSYLLFFITIIFKAN